MATGMWTSVSGAAAQSQAVDLVANNLANADTIAFKKDAPTFKEYLATVEREPEVQDIPRGPIKDKEFYPLDGRDQSFVVVTGTHTNFKPGGLKVTQSPLDIAMDGPGFLEVSTPQGSRFTRVGSMKIALDGRLVTNEGYPILAAEPGGISAQIAAAQAKQQQQALQNGQRTPANAAPGTLLAPNTTDAARFISLQGKTAAMSITPQGDIYAGDELIAKLNVVEFADLSKLKKVGGQLFENREPANLQAPQKTIVRQGVIETSNVNPIEEMTNLIKANRLFEHDLKAMKTYNDLMGREANDIGKL